MPPRTGRVVAGRYRLIEPIGRGAMGVVWRASDQLLDRDVAVKEVHLNAALGDGERANAYRRTLREARTAARLSHRGVVTVFDVVEEDGRPWIIMELIRSQSLDGLLATDGPMPPKRAARIAEQLLSALAHAHAAGVLHRDVKPSNVLIATGAFDERAVLTDFGIAQFAGDPRLTQTGMVMGSPGFTAPERIRGGDATPASDLWSLGATMYAACEGRGPYEQRGGAITTMTAIINEDAPAAPAADRLGGVIAALLRRDPARRPTASTAASMIAEMLPTLPDARRGRVQRTATALVPARSARRSPGRGGSGSGSPAAPPEGAGLIPPPAPPLSSDVAPTGLDAPEPAVASHDKPRPAAKVPAAVPAASANPAAPSGAAATAAPEARTPAPVTPVAPASAPAAAPSAPAPAEGKAAPRPAAAVPVAAVPAAAVPASVPVASVPVASVPAASTPALASSPEATPAPRPPAASAATPATPAPAAAPEAPPPPASPAPAPPEVAIAPDATAAETPGLSPNAAFATVAPALSAAAAGAGTGEAATGILTAAEPTVTAAGTGQGADAGADEPVTAPTVPVRVLAPVAEMSADAAVSVPGKEKDAWWATAYQADRSSPRPSPSQPGGSGSKGLPAWASSGPGMAPPSLPYLQQAPASGTGTQRTRGKGRLTAILALAAVVVIAVIVAAMMLTTHGNHGSTPGTRTRTSSVSSTSVILPVPPFTKNDVGVIQGINHPDAAVPSGWTTERLTSTQTGTAAGFSVNVPPGWQVMPQQSSPMRFFIQAPDGISNVEIDLTPPAKSDMVAQAEFVKHTSLAQGTFPGYQEMDLKPVNVRGTRGALWLFDWVNKNGTQIRVDYLFFVLPTKNGPQFYAIYMTAPEGNTWHQQILPLVEKMLQSFKVVPSGG